MLIIDADKNEYHRYTLNTLSLKMNSHLSHNKFSNEEARYLATALENIATREVLCPYIFISFDIDVHLVRS
jgi:hypothetical protein